MYDVMLKDSVVGSVVLRRQGAYYLLECHCSVHMTKRYHLMLTIKDKETDLGLCVPHNNGLDLKKFREQAKGNRIKELKNNGLELNTRIKVSIFGDNIPLFALSAQDITDDECSLAIKTDEPFAEISRIQYGRLNIQNGVYKITFPEADRARSPIQQDSDPSQEYPRV